MSLVRGKTEVLLPQSREGINLQRVGIGVFTQQRIKDPCKWETVIPLGRILHLTLYPLVHKLPVLVLISSGSEILLNHYNKNMVRHVWDQSDNQRKFDDVKLP